MRPVHLSLRRVMTAFVLFNSLAFSTAAARAADVPKLNVEPLCRGITDQATDPLEAGDPNVSFKQCLESEQADRATLEKEWATFSAANKKNCTDEAETGGLSSYTELLTCLEMARDVDKDNKDNKEKPRPPAQQSSPGRRSNTR
jgi:hypothetical protein